MTVHNYRSRQVHETLNGVNPSSSFRDTRSAKSGPNLWQIWQNLILKIQGQGQMTMLLHNYRSRQFHRTWNGINPSSGFRDMCSAKSGPSAAWFDKFLAHGRTHMGQMGQITMTVHNYRSRQVHETLNGVNPSSSFQRYAFRKVWTQFVANLTSFWPMGKPIWGKWAMTMAVHNYRPRQFHRTSNGENPSSAYRYGFPQVWQPPARPNRDNTPPAWRAEG